MFAAIEITDVKLTDFTEKYPLIHKIKINERILVQVPSFNYFRCQETSSEEEVKLN